MTRLLEVKEFISSFYKKFEKIIVPVGKFLFAFIVLVKLNNFLGYFDVLNKPVVNIAIAVLAAFIPGNWFILVLMLIVTAQVFFASIEGAIILAIGMLILYLLFVNIFPKRAIFVILVPLMFSLKLGYVVPIFAGLFFGLTSVIAIGVGVIVYRFSAFLPALLQVKSETLYDMPDTIMSMNKFVINTVLKDNALILTVAIFILVVVITYVISRFEVDHIWYIAIIAGGVVNILGFIIGVIVIKADISIMGVIFGTIFAIILCSIAQFMRFSLDYQRSEKVQFEDDEYYYYVKALPKIKVTRADKEVKKIK